MEENQQLGIIILAAGKASRMGKPKALLTYRGNSLLEHTFLLANSVNPLVITCVLGHYYQEMSAHCQEKQIPFILNEDYEKGMSTSIQRGLKHLLSLFPDLTMVLILLADQPHIESHHLSKMIQRLIQHHLMLVCTTYRSTFGVPALFNKQLFVELLEISGEKGAKHLIQRHITNELNTILNEKGQIDIDSPLDYEQLIQMEKLTN
jgi:molybdenum cofactor cytidylyltransferase